MRAERPAVALLRAGVLAALLVAPLASHAAWPRTRADFARLPKYCAARSASRLDWVPETSYGLWRQRMGPDFLHVHHYCAGLHTLHLARLATDERQRRALLQGALSEMRYTRDHASRGFLLQPEIRTQMAKIRADLGQPGPAMELLRSALELRPTYTPAYAALADILAKAGQRAEARRVLEEGLKQRPGSKLLRRRLARLTAHQP